MGLPVIYVGTHDSIGVGEDGPTHQPIEQLAMLRAIPNVTRAPARRCDRNGRGVADGAPADRRARRRSCSRARSCRCSTEARSRRAAGVAARRVRPARARGRPAGDPDRHRLRGARGARGGARLLQAEGIRARVVSLPSWELFAAQPAGVPRTRCCPPAITARVVSIEAATHLRLASLGRRPRRDRSASITSAPPPRRDRLFQEFGLTADARRPTAGAGDVARP